MIYEKIVQSQKEPARKNVMWVDIRDPEHPVTRVWMNGQWMEVSSEESDIQILQGEIDNINEEIGEINGRVETLEDNIDNKLDINTFYKILEYERACQQYLTIEATEDNTQLSWLFPNGFDTSLAKTIQYSTDNGLTWNSVTADVGDYGNLVDLNAGQKVLLRGSGATGFYDEGNDDYAGNFLYTAKPCYVYGNAMSLLYGANFANETSVPEYALAYLFCDYNENVSGEWVSTKEGNPLVLPATTLAEHCYFYMFSGCTSLTAAPELPATTLAERCYSGMFSHCESLTTAPELPATTLEDNCYSEMFSDCASLTTAPELPATTLAARCYYQMFGGCTSLTAAPELPATTLADRCYAGMFSNCTSLVSVKCLASAVLPSNAVQNWLSGVSATGTFTKAADVEWPEGVDGIPSGWEVVEV